MKRWPSLFLILCSLSAWADLGIEYANQTTAVIYRAGDTVYYELCPGKTPHPPRGCSGKDSSQIYNVEADRYYRGIHSFYSLTDHDYAGVSGGENLDSKISSLKEHLDHDDLTVDELHAAESRLRQIVGLKDRWDRADREILRYLDSASSLTLTEEFQAKRTQLAQLAFYGVAFLPDQGKLYQLSGEEVGPDAQDSACRKSGDAWSAIGGGIDPTLAATLSQSGMFAAGQAIRVWTTTATSGGNYRMTCTMSYPCQGNTERVEYYSVEEMHQHQETCAHFGFSVCYGTASGFWYDCKDRISGESYDYIPRGMQVVDLGPGAEASFAPQTEPIEGGEGTTLSVSHRVLCRRDFKMDTNDADRGYLNEPHFTSFSLFELDHSFERLAHSVYPNRAVFFRQLSEALGAYPLYPGENPRAPEGNAGARLFALEAVDPIMHDIPSRFVERYVLPDYLQAKEQWSKRLGAETLTAIPLTPAVYRVAVNTLRGALEAAKPTLSADDKRQAEELMLAVGQALAAGPAGRAALTAQLKGHKDLLGRIAAGARTGGFGVMMTAIGDYLEKK